MKGSSYQRKIGVSDAMQVGDSGITMSIFFLTKARIDIIVSGNSLFEQLFYYLNYGSGMEKPKRKEIEFQLVIQNSRRKHSC